MLTVAKIEHLLRPMMARTFSPEFFVGLYSKNRKKFIESLSTAIKNPVPIKRHEVKAFGVTFRNDLGNAAGLDKDGSLLEFNYCTGAGFAIVGTVLNKPHTGNLIKVGSKECNPWTPLPHSHSALNSLGLPSLGVDIALENINKFRQKYPDKDFPIGLSIMGHPLQDGDEKLSGILECVSKAIGKVDFIEINESCPNVAHKADDGLEKRLKAIADIKKQTPILVKLGSIGDADTTIKSFYDWKMDGIVLLNTQKDYPFYRPRLNPKDHKLFDYYTNKHQGGLSGTIIKDTSFDSARKAHNAIDKLDGEFALIHVGGILSADDIQESRKYAPLREWYTGMMERLCSGSLQALYSEVI
jgi:dihydroorotate dehydrogenase